MTPVLLAASSAVLFGAMTVLVRIALDTGVAPAAGSFLTILPACIVTAIVAVARGEWDLANAWPFVLAGLLAPGIAQILFTFAVRDAGASRTSVTVGTAPLFAVATALVFLDEPLVAGLLAGRGAHRHGRASCSRATARGPSTSSASDSSSRSSARSRSPPGTPSSAGWSPT